ncbi:hypothetical protein LMG33818_001996 [Halomonadaceae bacterium LMG 33818]
MNVDGVDHVHIEVTDRAASAKWYEQVLGLVQCKKLAQWGDNKHGPWILATIDDQPALALFQWDDVVRPKNPRSRDNTIAFRVSGTEFITFVHQMPEYGLVGTRTKTLITGTADIVDHDVAWSIYFMDPDENCLELTTYDYAAVATFLNK